MTQSNARILVLAASRYADELRHAGFQVTATAEAVDAAVVERPTPSLVAELRRGGVPVVAMVAAETTSEAMGLALACDADLILEPPGLAASLSRALGQGPKPRAGSDAVRVGPIVGPSQEMSALWRLVSKTAPLQAPVLVLGETGAGKEMVARALHLLSSRRGGPFVAVNCAALPVNLLESELFGHEKGAFTGAVARHIGRFELAHQGTLLLDEVGELPLEMQAKLLRVLQESRVERLGGERPITVDVRVIAATNRRLEDEVDRGTFRADLLYRLAALKISVPALRHRPADILPLWQHFVAQAAHDQGLEAAPETLAAATRALLVCSWPGNVRQVQNAARHAVAVAGGALSVEDLPDDVAQVQEPEPQRRHLAGRSLEELERDAILDTYEAVGNAAQAADLLGISVRKLFYRLRQYRSVQPPPPRPRVVIAEDDDDVRLSLAQVLRREGYEVTDVPNGADVLQHIGAAMQTDRGAPMVITDLRMPGLNGLRLLEALRAMGLSIPVILISAFIDEEVRGHALRLGARDVLDKPLDLGRLMAALKVVSV